ncbi:MAG: cryptochrome/photolyase family protein [Flavobacteriaceae bacterium]|nr:cryptochrome/photolyase family protein [Flavobacteriaceae bacterium]
MSCINIIFPNQLFEKSFSIFNKCKTYLIEENLFFKQYNFHKQKIFFHRSSMKSYENFLIKKGVEVIYIDSNDENSDIRNFINNVEISKINIYDPEDNWLEKRIKETCKIKKIEIKIYENPLFLISKDSLFPFFNPEKKKLFQTSFYKSQRKKFNILINEYDKPTGGKWTYDDMNRKKFPKNKKTPVIDYTKIKNKNFLDSYNYVKNNFSKNFGEINSLQLYPTDFKSAKIWFNNFLKTRFDEFGIYEDAVLINESIINHSVISPLINSGLLDPNYIVKTSLDYYKKYYIPLNSIEGFIRQIIGWREFIRGVYYSKGTEERTKNYWNFKRKIPKSFYEGSTGIDPIDDTIKKVKKTAYGNHIERLMILGNFMVLCEFDPDEVYKWFMEVFIDSYDWVMVPNVYGMSQFADGGMMSTKPYISSSNYIIKMSDYKKGKWCEIWDGLFWNFMDKQRDFFKKNPRMRMLIKSYDKMDLKKKEKLLLDADDFLNNL